MPGFDRSGPMGAGSMTGGARGYCNSENARSGRPLAGSAGFGRGMGRGYSRGFSPYPPMYAENTAEELGMFKQQVDSVKNTLDSINRRIADLEK